MRNLRINNVFLGLGAIILVWYVVLILSVLVLYPFILNIFSGNLNFLYDLRLVLQMVSRYVYVGVLFMGIAHFTRVTLKIRGRKNH
jgi:hypothetical protein